MTRSELIDRLRRTALECSAWSGLDNPPYTEWSDLMDEAAAALDRDGQLDPDFTEAH